MPQNQIFYKKNNAIFLNIVIIAILIAGIFLSAYIYFLTKNSNEKILLNQALIIAQLVDKDIVKELSGSSMDLSNPDYIGLKNKLKGVVGANPDIRFVYLVGKKDSNIFFFLDSESELSGDYSPPGQIYNEAGNVLHRVFADKNPAIEGPLEDRWGLWVSAFVPILDDETGQIIAVTGVDMPASLLTRFLWTNTSLPVAVTIFLLAIVILYYLYRQKELKNIALRAESISIASHEIRSQLNGIVWGMQFLKNKIFLKLPEKELNIFTLVENNYENLLMTVNGLLELYSLGSAKKIVKLEKVDVCFVLLGVTKNLELSAKEKNIVLSFEKPDNEILIFAEKERIKRMFNNLIYNAIKYSYQNGTVKIMCKETDQSCIVGIIDNGIGVPINEQKKIFQGFYRADNAKKSSIQGTGLGLYYAKMIVQLYKGRIWLESKEGQGSAFYVEFNKL